MLRVIVRSTNAALNSLIDCPGQRRTALEAALRPFSVAVYNDNGDVTISTGHLTTQDWLRARRLVGPFQKPNT